jgi:hypothetical protein
MEPMPTNRVTMRRIREALRLHLQAGLSYNEVGLALKISKSVVGKYVSLARAAGVDWLRPLTTKPWRPGCTARRCLAQASNSLPTSPSSTRNSSAPTSP